MAFTLFHCAVVWPLFITKPNRFDFLGLSVGAVMPDFLEPIVAFVPTYYSAVRSITHSLIGAATLIFILALLVAVTIAPKLLEYLKHKYRDRRFHVFNGIDILKNRPNLGVISYSTLMGATSHVTIDIFFHKANLLLYPFGVVSLPLTDLFLWRIIAHGIITLAFLYLAYMYWWKSPVKADSVKD
jgi:hypothetical protein